jgi:hypothetical protein
MTAPDGPLWVITSYYNPAGYRRRLLNFRAFRRNLAAPLLVVELTPHGQGELGDDDADMVIRLGGDDRIWQKERLLNIAIARLPDHVRHVAWADADLLFADPHWPEQAAAALDRHGGMVQLFDTAHHLASDIDPQTVDAAQCGDATPLLSGISLARSMREGQFGALESDWGKRSTNQAFSADRYHVYGFAWAARRETLLACGLYEGNVVGGSDALAAFALIDRLEAVWERRAYTDAHKAHVRQWADRAAQAGLFAQLHDLPQTVWHLWHGAIVDRNYAGRYAILADAGYDPVRDLVAEPGQPLRWASPGGALADAVGAYFFAHREDGA